MKVIKIKFEYSYIPIKFYLCKDMDFLFLLCES